MEKDKKAPKELYFEIEIPEGVQVKKEDYNIIVEGPQGKVEKVLRHPMIDIIIESNLIKIKPKKQSRREKKILGTFKSHIKNLIQGVQEKFEYVLKICSGHFPMTVTHDKNKIIIKNFLGERIPRKAEIQENVEVKIEGELITIISTDKEKAGQSAANIEKATRIKGRDNRIFQDGIYIIKKCGKDIK